MRKFAAGIAIAVLAVGLGAPAHADPDDETPGNPTQNEVCGAFNLGVPQSEIAQRLQRNDARYNVWRAWQDTNWPIIDGQCDH